MQLIIQFKSHEYINQPSIVMTDKQDTKTQLSGYI